MTALSISALRPLTFYLIPAPSSLVVPMLYVFMHDIMSERGAQYSGLLLMAATPYLYWVLQGRGGAVAVVSSV